MNIFKSILIMMGLGLAINVWASDVWIGDHHFSGHMNVAFNLDSQQAYIGSSFTTGYSVTFFARDQNMQHRYCYVTPTSPIYQDAIQVHASLKQESYLYVRKEEDGSDCVTVFSHILSTNLR